MIYPPYIESSNKELCSGCSACSNVCGHKAIVMKEDAEGFLYPAVDISDRIALAFLFKLVIQYFQLGPHFADSCAVHHHELLKLRVILFNAFRLIMF